MNIHDAVENNAERAIAEIKLMGAMARKMIRRIAEFPARSEGQRSSYKKVFAKGSE